MIFKYIFSIFIFFSLTGDQYVVNPALTADSIVTKDTNNKISRIKETYTVPEIKFKDSKLAPLNVRIIFNDFFNRYIGIKESLVYNDSYGAGSKTLELLDLMKSKSDEVNKETKDARWDIFIQNYNSIRNKVKDIKFISDQRFTFGEISRGLESFIKQYGLHDKTVYLMQYRDDAENKNLYWLSDKKDFKNPYLGTMNDSTNTKLKEVWIFE